MAKTASDHSESRVERIWDLPTRLLKWSLALAVAIGYLLGEFMNFSTIQLHFYAGYTVAALLALRLIWGFIGARASRHSVMLRDAAKAPAYAKTLFSPTPSHWPGHNPLGALSVYALWTVIALQVATGLFAYNDSFFSGGPLSETVSEATRNAANGIHEALSGALITLVALHVGAIIFYAVWKREFLIGPMISGDKTVRDRRD